MRAVMLGFVTLQLSAHASLLDAQPRPKRRRPVDSIATQTPPLKTEWAIQPDTVSVGDVFTFRVTLEVPIDAVINWPTITDTAAAVSVRAPAKVSSDVSGAVRRETADYRMAAWDVGMVPIALPDIAVRTKNGVVSATVRGARIAVMTVLPLDTSLRVPKPLRPPFPRVVPWWELWWPAAAVVAALLALWWLWRVRRRRVIPHIRESLGPFEQALADFERLERQGFETVGERGRAVALASEVLRTYLAARVAPASLARTSDEVLAIIENDPRVPSERIAQLFAHADRIKFAKERVALDDVLAYYADARAMVQWIEAADRARRLADQQARDAAALHTQKAERVAKAADEDAARRRSRRPTSGVS